MTHRISPIMLLSTLVLLIISFVGSASAAEPAPQVDDNTAGVAFSATLQQGKPVSGTLTGASAKDGRGIAVSVSFHDFPVELGPFSYHIHVSPFPEDGNCTAAGPHLDPYNATEMPPCDKKLPQTCQVGDLSGKHDKIAIESSFGPVGGSYLVTYQDSFLATSSDDVAFFGNRSVVVHASNGTRLNCGNFVLGALVGPSSNETQAPGGGNGTYTSSTATGPKPSGSGSSALPTGASPTASSPGTPKSTGAASELKAGAQAVTLALGILAITMMAL